MTYNTKAEFMAALKSQAEKYSLSFGEMAEDFERHFSEGEENGETESEICAKLGDPVEIVKEYVGENSENVQSSNSNEQNITAGINRVDSNTGKISGGMITGVILLDLFVLDWALPTLASLVIVYIAVAFAFIVSGVVSIISVMLPFVSDSVTALLFGRMFNVFAGMVILGLDISVLSANANISYNSGNAVKVSYVTVDKNKKIECNITDGTLNIKEKSGFSFFSLFTLASVPTKIEISFPESYRDNGTLENADVTVASGSLSGDMPHTEKSTKIQLYSGKINSSVAAENFDINVSSGLADISSRTHKHKNVNVSVLSGKTTLDGFISEKSKYSLTSGKIASLNAGGGELYTNVTSGSLTLGCAEKITGIDAKVASGKAHISAPKDTGARVAYSVASGSIKIGLDGRNEKLTGSGSISYGNAEANVNVNVASGSFILDTYTLSE